MQTEIIKDTGYDSTETENTLYDEGYDGSVKKTNPEETNNTQKNSTPSHTTTKVSTTTTETNNENTEDVFEKYNLQCLKKELSEESSFKQTLIKNKLDFILSPIFYVILFGMHVFYSIYLMFNKIISNIKDKLAEKKFELTPKTLSMNVVYLKKIPKHLSFIIQIQPKDHENPTELFHNIKQLIYWSIEVGIPYISFYDYNSFLKQHIKEIANTFDEEVHFPAAPEFSIKFNGSGDLVTARHLTNTYILNNNEKQKTFYSHFHVNFISYDDGKPQIAKVASLLSKTMKSSEVQCMTIEAMNEVISKYTFKNDGCDPELIIIYGGTPEYFQLYGYPPWQIRLSEIYYVPGKKDITYAGFINGLFRYSRCEQRVGK
ncbi:Undecaprenyl diphosphate synthase [Piromyces finnis]|uniref:ditrans,polycis-polyprenyl diphosphate synthase [(2E,6E)-farnesyldiphosphate specific] n=1 Tax=Piromyces finnis TaxID=1754191 RepID=A0A1Y1V1B0_9FUNG|nr:Undecaprenyl diphosphate synthase [Piromyces finnis]|eukprot:ORX45058.1 Undecaprenyl diphosphate synthase [Piromyces finnis]